ncbi:MAG: S-layer homology domain-containing protein, partial [Lysinibacillus sp.]
RAEKMSMSELWKSFSKEEQMQGSLYQSGYVLLKKQIIDDRLQWTLIEKNIDGTSLDEKLVAQFSKMPLADPEVAFDVEKIKDMANIDAFIEYVQAEIEGKTLNEQDVTILVDFLSVGIQFFAQQALDAKKNELAVESEMLTAMVEEVNKLEQKITTELKLADHHLTKKLQTVVRFNVNHVDTNQAVQINLNKEMLQGLTEKDLVNKKIYFSLDGSTRGVLIKLSDLYQMFTKYDEVQVSISYLDKKIKLMIMDANGHEIGKLLIPIEIVAPVPSKDYVMFYDKEVWGGQYNDKNKSIIFQTKKSGTYDLVKNDVKISDIDKLTDEQKEAIEFLVARGFFDIEGDKFVPTATITRNDFSKTLVRLFFALDTDAKDNFSDVEKDSPYYKYISSGKENNILQGYPDETFRGENLISMSHVLSLAGRTLHSVKGYELTDDASKYLQFIDSERILDHARGDIALAIRENIYEQGGLLEPQRQITRLEAAEILMKLYTKLYDQPQYLYAVNVEQEKGSSINKWYVVVGIITSAIVVLLVLVVRRRKRVSKD